MKVGDLVSRQNPPIPGLDKIFGIVTELYKFPDDDTCVVMWPDGRSSIPFKKNLKVVNGS